MTTGGSEQEYPTDGGPAPLYASSSRLDVLPPSDRQRSLGSLHPNTHAMHEEEDGSVVVEEVSISNPAICATQAYKGEEERQRGHSLQSVPPRRGRSIKQDNNNGDEEWYSRQKEELQVEADEEGKRMLKRSRSVSGQERRCLSTEQHHQLVEAQSARARAGLEEVLRRGLQQVMVVERAGLERATKEALQRVREEGEAMKSSATSVIRELNSELEGVQSLGLQLVEEAEALRRRVEESLGPGREAAALDSIKTMVEAEMRSLQAKLESLVTDAGPYCVIQECNTAL